MEPSFSHAQGGGGVTLPVTVAQDAFNNVQLIGTDMPNLVGDLENGTGYDNIAIGLESYDNFGNFDANPYVPDSTHYALAAVTTGFGNVAIGGSALKAVTTGNYNIAIGDAAGIGITTAQGNIAIGAYAAMAALTGNNNVLIGGSTGQAMTTGAGNMCVGSGAGSHITTGGSNVCFGGGAGSTLTTGSDNTLIGEGALTSAADTAGAVAIGKSASAASGQCVIGNESAGAYPLALGFAGATAPADADIQNGQAFLYWDFSASGVVLKYKGKAADGTVISKTVTVS